MVGSAIDFQQQIQELKMPLPDRLPDGTEPESRVIVCGLCWDSYLEWDKALRDDRSAPVSNT